MYVRGSGCVGKYGCAVFSVTYIVYTSTALKNPHNLQSGEYAIAVNITKMLKSL